MTKTNDPLLCCTSPKDDVFFSFEKPQETLLQYYGGPWCNFSGQTCICTHSNLTEKEWPETRHIDGVSCPSFSLGHGSPHLIFVIKFLRN